MKVNFPQRATVNARFGFADAGEDASGQILLRLRQDGARVDLLDNVMQMPMSLLLGMIDADLLAAKAFSLHLGGTELNLREPQRIDTGLNGRQVDAAIDERSERHIAADPAGTIEVSNFHREAFTIECHASEVQAE